MTWKEQLAFAQAEIRKHDFDCFVDKSGLPLGHRGIVVSECPHCKKTIYTMAQFIEHLAVDILPLIFQREPGVD